MASRYIKSPLNYIGGKYKMLPQLLELFPAQIGTMVDLFAGGGDVFANIEAETIIANDINYFVIDIFKALKGYEIKQLLSRIECIIETWRLSPTDESAYLLFRSHYNQTKDPLELFVLVCYSFNHQIRFNSHHEFNNPFGKNRSWFNQRLRGNLVQFHGILDKISFTSEDFKNLKLDFLSKGDFVYADPPYLITTGSYNDGKRGFNGWTEQDEVALYGLLDSLSEKGVNFALSNVSEHKGRHNELLEEWSLRYRVHPIRYNYSNSSYHGKNTEKITKEILVTNYLK